MEEAERNARNYITAMQGTTPCIVRGHEVRKLSLETLIVLQLTGHPMAAFVEDAMKGKDPSPLKELQIIDCVMVVWMLTEDPDEVLRTANECAPGFTSPARTAAVQFTRGWSMEEISKVITYVTEDMKATQAAAYDAAPPDMGDGKKKA